MYSCVHRCYVGCSVEQNNRTRRGEEGEEREMNWLTMHLDTGLPPAEMVRVSQGHRASLVRGIAYVLPIVQP